MQKKSASVKLVPQPRNNTSLHFVRQFLLLSSDFSNALSRGILNLEILMTEENEIAYRQGRNPRWLRHKRSENGKDLVLIGTQNIQSRLKMRNEGAYQP